LTASLEGGKAVVEDVALREVGRFEPRKPRDDRRAPARWPKPDFVRTALNAAELHAYYIAIVSSRSLAMTPKHALKSR